MDDKMDYKQSGVDLNAADNAVENIKDIAGKATRPEVLSGVGGFGGLFRFNVENYREPVLVAGTDGVGTKLKLATEMQKHDTIGEDLVAMCVNDILVQGAEPLFFMDYLAVGKLESDQVAEIISGVASGCQKAGCALLGGETAEMPGFYPPGEYDVAGFAVGAVEREKIVDGSSLQEGDLLLGLASKGVHSNGYSLIRKIIETRKLNLNEKFINKGAESEGVKEILGEELLRPTEIYVPQVLPLLEKYNIKGMVHITGGGLPGNLPRILPSQLSIKLYPTEWEIPDIFYFIKEKGNVDWEEMYRVFNMGIGFVLFVSPNEVKEIQSHLAEGKTNAWIIGEITAATEEEIIIEK